jgi:hypothetical protein
MSNHFFKVFLLAMFLVFFTACSNSPVEGKGENSIDKVSIDLDNCTLGTNKIPLSTLSLSGTTLEERKESVANMTKVISREVGSTPTKKSTQDATWGDIGLTYHTLKDENYGWYAALRFQTEDIQVYPEIVKKLSKEHLKAVFNRNISVTECEWGRAFELNTCDSRIEIWGFDDKKKSTTFIVRLQPSKVKTSFNNNRPVQSQSAPATITFFKIQDWKASKGGDQPYTVSCSDGSYGVASETNVGSTNGSFCASGGKNSIARCKPKNMWSLSLAAQSICAN